MPEVQQGPISEAAQEALAEAGQRMVKAANDAAEARAAWLTTVKYRTRFGEDAVYQTSRVHRDAAAHARGLMEKYISDVGDALHEHSRVIEVLADPTVDSGS